MTIPARFLLYTIACLTAAILGPATAICQSVAPLPAPTVITTAPYTISRPGYYQLGADLYYAGNGSANDAIITINASNVTLDFAGHYISGPSGTPGTKLYGTYANEKGNITVENGTVAYCYLGVVFVGTGQTGTLNINERVTNMLISYCYTAAVDFDGCFNSDLLDSRISFIGGGTFFLAAYGLDSTGTGIKVSNNEITNVASSTGNAGTSVGLYNSASTFSTGNTISNCPIGIQNGKYQNNLTYGCTTPFTGGTDCGGNY